MPKRTDIDSILIIGAGPIVIGQACEFDYSGTQACKALKEEGYRVVLVNSNPATIMTDPDTADRTYIEPLTWEIVAKVIAAERPDALLPTLGGQTGLNLANPRVYAEPVDHGRGEAAAGAVDFHAHGVRMIGNESGPASVQVGVFENDHYLAGPVFADVRVDFFEATKQFDDQRSVPALGLVGGDHLLGEVPLAAVGFPRLALADVLHDLADQPLVGFECPSDKVAAAD
jgi:hypothetical protein